MASKKVSSPGYIEIYEEPASKRFRYESEGRSAPLEGVRTTKDAKTSPSIRIRNYTGQATVIVSCVEADKPYRQHPHKLVGKNCAKGICYIPEFYTNSANPEILTFPELRIQNCKKPEIPERLEERRRLNINPFDLSKYGKDNSKRNIHKVRLCFQVLISPNPEDPTIRAQFKPIVSKPIINNKGAAEMKILDISDTYSPASGGKKIIICCNTVVKDDIEIRFYEEDADKRQTLIGLGYFEPHNVHRNAAISFTTPKYDLKVSNKLSNVPKIFIRMQRPSDNAQSNPVSFQYVFDGTDIDTIYQKKREKVNKSKELFESVSSYTRNNVPSSSEEEKESQQQKKHCNTVHQHYNIPQHGNHHQQVLHHQQQNLPPHRSETQHKQVQPNLLQANSLQQKHQQSHQYSLPQHRSHNLSQPQIPQEQFNQQHYYDPHRQHNLQYQYNPQNPPPMYYPQQNNGELLDLGAMCLNYFDKRSPPSHCSQEDQIMTSANMIIGAAGIMPLPETKIHRIF